MVNQFDLMGRVLLVASAVATRRTCQSLQQWLAAVDGTGEIVGGCLLGGRSREVLESEFMLADKVHFENVLMD